MQEVACCHARSCVLSRKRLRVVTQEVAYCHARGCVSSRKRLRVVTQEVACCHASGCVLSRKRLRVRHARGCVLSRKKVACCHAREYARGYKKLTKSYRPHHHQHLLVPKKINKTFPKMLELPLTSFCYFKYDIMAKTFLISINCFTGKLAIIPSNLVKPSSPSIGQHSKVIKSLPFAAVHRLGFSKI